MVSLNGTPKPVAVMSTSGYKNVDMPRPMAREFDNTLKSYLSDLMLFFYDNKFPSVALPASPFTTSKIFIQLDPKNGESVVTVQLDDSKKSHYQAETHIYHDSTPIYPKIPKQEREDLLQWCMCRDLAIFVDAVYRAIYRIGIPGHPGVLVTSSKDGCSLALYMKNKVALHTNLPLTSAVVVPVIAELSSKSKVRL